MGGPDRGAATTEREISGRRVLGRLTIIGCLAVAVTLALAGTVVVATHRSGSSTARHASASGSRARAIAEPVPVVPGCQPFEVTCFSAAPGTDAQGRIYVCSPTRHPVDAGQVPTPLDRDSWCRPRTKADADAAALYDTLLHAPELRSVRDFVGCDRGVVTRSQIDGWLAGRPEVRRWLVQHPLAVQAFLGYDVLDVPAVDLRCATGATS